MTAYEILEKIEYEYDLNNIDMLLFNNYTYLTSRQYNCLINEFKKTNDKKIHDFLYANSYIIYRAIYNKRYSSSTYTLKVKNGYYEPDILQEFPFIFYYILDKYKDIGEASSYNSYIDYHYRYYITELIRTKYYQVMRIPQKQARLKETRRFKTELYEDMAIIDNFEEDLVDKLDNSCRKLISEVNKMIKKKLFTKRDWEIFLKFNGLWGNEAPKELKVLAVEFKLKDTNAVYWRVTKVLNACRRNTVFKMRNSIR